MGKSSSAAPAAPDPAKTAQAQTALDFAERIAEAASKILKDQPR